MKIYYQVVKIYFRALKIYFQAMKIVLDTEVKLFTGNIKQFYP